MSRLIDIKGYWDMSGEYNFNEHNMWEGKLLLEGDGWFEGIVSDPTSSYTGDRMIFGIYHPTEVIELLKVSPKSVSNPLVFRCKRDARGYDGTFSAVGFSTEIPCGVAHLITRDVLFFQENNDPEVIGRDIEAEKDVLTKRIASFKQTSDYKELYENTIGMRAELSDYVLRSCNGETFTKEQIEEYLEPVADKVAEDTGNALVKLMHIATDQIEDDEELPF